MRRSLIAGRLPGSEIGGYGMIATAVRRLVLAALLAAPVPGFAAAQYDVTIVPMPAPAPGATTPLIANIFTVVGNDGTVVGFHHQWDRAVSGDNGYTPAIYSGGKLTPITHTLGGPTVAVYGINASGHFVGTSDLASGHRHAFLYANGALKDLGAMGHSDSVALAVNDQDDVAGTVSDSASLWSGRAFLVHNGEMKDLNDVIARNPALFKGEAYTLTEAAAINNKGHLVVTAHSASGTYGLLLFADGTLSEPDPAFQSTHKLVEIGRLTDDDSFIANAFDDDHQHMHAYVYSAGRFQPLGSLGGGFSEAFGINADGAAVGGSNHRAFLAQDGAIADLNTRVDPANLMVQGRRYVLGPAMSINDDGVIVGNAGVEGAQHSAIFILTPRRHHWLWWIGGLIVLAAGGYLFYRTRRHPAPSATAM